MPRCGCSKKKKEEKDRKKQERLADPNRYRFGMRSEVPAAPINQQPSLLGEALNANRRSAMMSQGDFFAGALPIQPLPATDYRELHDPEAQQNYLRPEASMSAASGSMPQYTAPAVSNGGYYFSQAFPTTTRPSHRPEALQNDLRPEATMSTASERIGVTPAGVYAWRPPSPPHIHIPQAADDHLVQLSNLPFTGQGYTPEDIAILQSITQHPDAKLSVRDWKYEQRRSAQSILSFVHLGPSASIRDMAYLTQQGITLLLAIRDRTSAMARLLSGDKNAKLINIEAQAIDVTGNQELIQVFPMISRVINDHLIRIHKRSLAIGSRKQGKVLVFCESGNERSAVAVVAYMMETYGLGMIDAVQYVQSQRFCVSFDDGLKNLLASFQDILDAQRSVRASSNIVYQTQVLAPVKKRGRAREDEEENGEDVDMDRMDDQERFSNRSNFVPFHDSR